MPNSDLLPSLLFKINQNQLALEAAIMELTLWVEQRGSGDVGGNVRGALETIGKNEDAPCPQNYRITAAAQLAQRRIEVRSPSIQK